MTTQITQKTKQKEEATPRGEALAPYREFPFFLSRMRDEFDRLLDRFTGHWPSLWEGAGDDWRWDVDVRDDDDAIVVHAEAPGFEAGDFDVQVQDNRLVLRASRKEETKGKEGKTREYREQKCYQSVTLPAGINKDKVEAGYHNGVLTVTLPKTAEGKGKRRRASSVLPGQLGKNGRSRTSSRSAASREGSQARRRNAEDQLGK
jgi:HSP20 family protein